jgi:replicative DNA helicase
VVYESRPEVKISPQYQQGLRKPPYSLEAEQALLGAILIDNRTCDRVSDLLKPEHFFDPFHGELYGIIVQLVSEGKTANPVTLAPHLESAEHISPDVSATVYLGSLAANATTTVNARDYARTIGDLYTRRQLIWIGETMAEVAHTSPIDFPPKAQIDEAETRLFALGETGKRAISETFNMAARAAVEQANQAYQRAGEIWGLGTYLADLDAKLGGMQPGDLIVLAGRPSMGKTALAINNIAFANAAKFAASKGAAGARVGVFSMEMTGAQLAMRVLAEQAEVPSEKIRRGIISEGEFKKFLRAVERHDALPMIIDQSGGLTISQLSARARRMKRQHDIGLIVIDYLQLMQGSKRNNRVEDVSEITTGLKALAKDLDVPILALSQLSRNVEHRQDKRPQLADLRESGSIEQDADVVMFVYREEYYALREQPAEGDAKYSEWMQRMLICTGKAEVIIGKQRHGPTGKVDVQFDGPLMRFFDLAKPTSVPAQVGGRYE